MQEAKDERQKKEQQRRLDQYASVVKNINIKEVADRSPAPIAVLVRWLQAEHGYMGGICLDETA